MYDAYYKLSSKPFQLSPDPRFFFGSQGHKRALAYLRYGVSQGEGFIIITGGIGTGKTMLVRTLFRELRSENIVAGQLVTTQIEADDMLRMVAATFGLAHEGMAKATLLRNLEIFFRARHQEGKRVLLVVDEVQNLPVQSLEELRMLSNFEVGGRSLLQSFLLGQEEFRDILQSEALEQLRQRVIAAHHLAPLAADETKGYIVHRLETAGWKDDPHFTEDAFVEIHKRTEGVPRRVNTLCDRLFLYGYLEELHQFDSKAVATVADEVEAETVRAGLGVRSGTRSAAPAARAVAAVAAAAAHVPPDVAERLARVEEGMERLRKVVQKEKVLLRKALLMSLDLDEEGNKIQPG